MSFKIVRNDITQMDTEAIVNTANADVAVGSGCDRAVYSAAGYDELLRFRRDNIGTVPCGEVFITPGFGLKARYIIHAVSPLYEDGNSGEEYLLRSCYQRSLALARDQGIRSIAFPLISTGSFAYPKEEGLRIAVDEINTFLSDNEMDVILTVFDDEATRLGARECPGLEEYIDRNYVQTAAMREYEDHMPCPDMTESRPVMPASDSDRRRDRSGRAGSLFESIFNAGIRKKTASAENGSETERDLPAMASREEFSGDESVCYGFEEEHESRLEERMRHMSDTYSEYLMYLIKEKKMENAEVWKRAIVDKKIFSKIKNNIHYHPNKLTALCLCIGARLNLDETRDLLARAGYALSPCDKTDIIFSYFIENEIYDMIELDIQLEEHGLPCIIS